MTVIETHRLPSLGLLRGPAFDFGFVIGIAALAIASGIVVTADPRLFTPILLLDLWILGYHHVVSTYTRLCFDRNSFREHRLLLLGLPVLVILGTAVITLGVGMWLLASVYLYWQWFHYTRQSWGVSQAYRRKSDVEIRDPEWLTKLTFYMLPAWGIIYRSWQAPETFLGLELRVIPMPEIAVQVAAVASLTSLAVWLGMRIVAFARGEGAPAHTLYLLSHYLVFAVGYLLIEDISYGWLVINIWHNAQYVLFVWHFNASKFKNGVSEDARVLSWISQTKNWWLYFSICIAISTAVYMAIGGATSGLGEMALPVALVVYMSINFHHYIVDSIIWKMRKRPMQQTLGLNGS